AGTCGCGRRKHHCSFGCRSYLRYNAASNAAELVPRRFRASNSILFPEDFEFVPRRLSPTCVN
ncbi:unnamed protein product, partial [Arabidopsis halleri]